MKETAPRIGCNWFLSQNPAISAEYFILPLHKDLSPQPDPSSKAENGKGSLSSNPQLTAMKDWDTPTISGG